MGVSSNNLHASDQVAGARGGNWERNSNGTKVAGQSGKGISGTPGHSQSEVNDSNEAEIYLKGEMYSALLLAQSFAILGEIGLIACSAVEETDEGGFESWNR
ncbi:hypothetical protein ACHAQH_005073 [Verticillium albo-atrum]